MTKEERREELKRETEEYEVSFDHAWPPSEEEMNRWIEEDRKFLALNENDGSILG